MANRPTFIDIRSHSHGPLSGGLRSPQPPPSPRFHVAGDVPPELSPLDAFAAQSRMLAKQLEGTNGARRMSKLPADFHQARPGFLRSASAIEPVTSTKESPTDPTPPTPTFQADVEAPTFRPVSVYPHLSNISPPRKPSVPPQTRSLDDESRGRKPFGQIPDFGTRREQSPGPIDQEFAPRTDTSPSYFSGRPSIDSLRKQRQSPRRPPEPLGLDTRLAPPMSPFARRTSSIRSNSFGDSDEDYSGPMSASFLSESRKFSSSTGLSTSPQSPLVHSLVRSPSISSEMSAGGSRLSRPVFNFSRPISRASFTEMPTRQTSSDSQSIYLADDNTSAIIGVQGEEHLDINDGQPAGSSYVYSRFILPRGKRIQRNSAMFQDNQQHEPREGMDSQTQQKNNMATSPLPSRPSTSSLSRVSSSEWGVQHSEEPMSRRGQPKYDGSLLATPRFQATPSIASGSTIKASSQFSTPTLSEMSADEHVTKGIECHEGGSLKESTYHLRVAARQNHPTGMLLYALACRHGWGMRANPQEAVQWLRKAADFAILEVADDEGLVKEGKTVDFLDRKTRKAQFALSVYELGVSHLNGWGIEQDKVLALRCFEIAGAWGDGDALAEAGFCYAQGVGCKKDMKKSAKFYREAESKGISMVGNSWIYKNKYKDEDPPSDAANSPEKKIRNRSRARSIFGRKKTDT